MPPVAEAIRMTHEGAVGRVQQVTIREHREPFYPKVGDWNRFRPTPAARWWRSAATTST